MAHAPHPAPRTPATPVNPGRLVDLLIQLDRDEEAAPDTLRRRDRAIGLRLGQPALSTHNAHATPSPADTAQLASAWLDALPDGPQRGRDTLQRLGLLAVLLGLVLGYATIHGVLWYDGSHPVNVVHILAVFVLLQGVTLLIFVLAALPSHGPLLGFVPQGLRSLSPGRWIAAMGRLSVIPQDTREALARVIGRSGAHQQLYGRVQRWQVLAWSQGMALAFNIAALAGAMQLIVFSDLSFGWSTTLEAEAEAMHAVTQAISLPWGAFWGDAVPPFERVRDTQVYRADGVETSFDARAAAGWWPFVIACLVTYGVLPRLVTLTVARWRLGRAVTQAVAITPGIDRVIDRMGSALVTTQAAVAELDEEGAVATASAGRDSLEAPSSAAVVFAWAGAGGIEAALPVGGERSLDEDTQAIARGASRLRDGESSSTVARVVVKAWEPPVLELLDFLRDLRAELGRGVTLEVMLHGQGDAAVWKKKLDTLGDPWLRLVREVEAAGITASSAEGQP